MAVKPRKVSKTNGEQFRALLKTHGLTVAEAAQLLRRPIKTLENWVSSPQAVNHRRMPGDTLEIFRIRLAEMESGK